MVLLVRKICKYLDDYRNPVTLVFIWKCSVRAFKWIPTWQVLVKNWDFSRRLFWTEFLWAVKGLKTFRKTLGKVLGETETRIRWMKHDNIYMFFQVIHRRCFNADWPIHFNLKMSLFVQCMQKSSSQFNCF